MSHRVFISYQHVDQEEVEDFIKKFDHQRNIFFYRALGFANDIINSNDTEYIMKRIRELYLKDSTVTIVMIGKCTWARKYVDWEIQASLRGVGSQLPNGLLGIILPSASRNPIYPERLNKNLPYNSNGKITDSYARVYNYPTRADSLNGWIEDAFNARTKRRLLIDNPRSRFAYNRTCF